MASVPTGTKLGKYEVVKPLASGGLAALVLARTSPTERPRVLKWIRPEQASDGTFVETFTREGRRAAGLHHPNIVEVHEVGRDFLAIEYVHGDDLRKLLARLHGRRAKLPVQHLLAISTAVAQALQYAHDQGTLHLGIKPANVIITSDGAVKLADFGISRAALTEGRTDLLPSIVGYLSPEQCTGQPLDRRSDVFGLGILMYELATTRRLFKGDRDLVTMATIVAGEIPAPTKVRSDLPKELEAVILKALARAPQDRFQTAQELHAALDKLASKAGVPGSLTTLAGYTKRLCGVRPEPWLTDEDPGDAISNELDGAPGLAVPPNETVQTSSLPTFVVAGDESPIMRVKKSVARDIRAPNLAAAPPEPVKVPARATRVLPKPLPQRPTPAPLTAAGRAKPKTIQIPTKVPAGDEDGTITAIPGTPPPRLPPPRPSLPVNGKLQDANAKREAAKRLDAERIPNPSVAGEIRARPTSATDVDLLGSITAVAEPPVVAATTDARDATEHVKPLPLGEAGSSTDANPGNKKRFVIGGLLVATAAAAVIAIGFTGGLGGDDVASVERSQVAAKPEVPESRAPRTPRNSHVTADDPKPAEPAGVEPAKIERVAPAQVEPNLDAVAVAGPPKLEPGAPAKVEPKLGAAAAVVPPKLEDPPPPRARVEKPKPTKTKRLVVQKQQPKPKPTPVAAKPKAKAKTKAKAAKPAGKWDPNALFPKK